MLIFVDVDDVCADLVTEWIRCYNADKDYNLKVEDITSWDIWKHVDPTVATGIYDYLLIPELYYNIVPIEGSLDGVRELRDMGHRVVFATTANTIQMKPKHEWLSGFGFFEGGDPRKDYITVGDKSLLFGDLLIDDGVHNIDGFNDSGIVFARPWNKECEHSDKYVYAYNWDNVVRLVSEGTYL